MGWIIPRNFPVNAVTGLVCQPLCVCFSSGVMAITSKWGRVAGGGGGVKGCTASAGTKPGASLAEIHIFQKTHNMQTSHRRRDSSLAADKKEEADAHIEKNQLTNSDFLLFRWYPHNWLFSPCWSEPHYVDTVRRCRWLEAEGEWERKRTHTHANSTRSGVWGAAEGGAKLKQSWPRLHVPAVRRQQKRSRRQQRTSVSALRHVPACGSRLILRSPCPPNVTHARTYARTHARTHAFEQEDLS